MNQVLSLAAPRAFAVVGALLATGCLTGIDVGQDTSSAGTGGAASSGSTTSGTGGAVTGASCASLPALLCQWGETGGPCGGSRPNKKDCGSGWVCLGGTADVEGTCALASDALLSPGDPCGNVSGMCPWNYACTGSFVVPGGVAGVCAPTQCSLDPIDTSAATSSITVDGDGPTLQLDFACPGHMTARLTGEANAYLDTGADNPSPMADLSLEGCGLSDGDTNQGALYIAVPSPSLGTTHNAAFNYFPPYPGEAPGESPLKLTQSAGTVTITELSATTVRGTYDTVVTGHLPTVSKHITGTFDVCRLPDVASP